jgi:hypothetical protein
MIKRKATVALLSLVALMALSGCDKLLEKGNDGVVLTLTSPTGVVTEYTADDLYGRYKTNSRGVAQFYEAALEVVIRNEFQSRPDKLNEIMDKADIRVDGVKETARSNADLTAGSNYKQELDNLLKSYNVEDLEELQDYFAYQLMTEEIEKDFYEDDVNKRELLVGADDGYVGYLDKMLPYHVRHILVKVSDNSSNIYDGNISEQDAVNLSSVVKRLATRFLGESFGQVAFEASEDDGSAAKYGDLGVMSKKTSFVNEFKLGLYTYDSIFNQNTQVVTNRDKLAVPDDAKTYMNGLGLATIPYEAALKLEEFASVTRDKDNNRVNDNDTKYYPRNIYFNQHFNRHNIGVIVPTNVDDTPNGVYEALPGFQEVSELGNQKVLTDERGRVILVVRAGTGDGESGYQGIHFIVVERSPLVDAVLAADNVTEVDLETYYSTEIPGTGAFPKDTNNNNLRTYVNYMRTNTREYRDRAETIKNELKSFDPMIQARIFEKYMANQAITFTDAELGESILNYIDIQRESNDLSNRLDYERTWEDYVRYLEYQEWQRGRLISEVCAEAFINNDGGVYNEGGACYVK